MIEKEKGGFSLKTEKLLREETSSQKKWQWLEIGNGKKDKAWWRIR